MFFCTLYIYFKSIFVYLRSLFLLRGHLTSSWKYLVFVNAEYALCVYPFLRVYPLFYPFLRVLAYS